MNSRFSALLLAGGKSSRMQRDKAWLEINGEPLWRRQLRILESLEPGEIFLAGPFDEENCITIADTQPNSGPLAGVAAGLRRCSSALLLVLAVDLPRMTSDYLRELVEGSADGAGVVPEGQPLCAVYPITALKLAEQSLASGEYSMQHFTATCLAQGLVRQERIPPAQEHLFLNLNTPDDLRRLSDA